MEACYIVMICSAVVFAALLGFFIYFTVKRRRKSYEDEKALEEAYADKNLAKMEYDIAFYDEETYRLMRGNGQVTMDEVMSDSAVDGGTEGKVSPEGAIFTKIDTEGVEEITGRFKK